MNYEIEKNRCRVSLRLRDEAARRLFAPPRPGAAELPRLSEAIDLASGATERDYTCRRRLVNLWATYMTERLALDRELSILPFDSWAAFLKSFVPTPSPPRKSPPAAPPRAPVQGPPAAPPPAGPPPPRGNS
jgi:hypothetical protein